MTTAQSADAGVGAVKATRAGLLAVWALVLAAAVCAAHTSSALAIVLLDWNPIPSDAIILFLVVAPLRRLVAGWRRRAWGFVAAATAANLTSNLCWVLAMPDEHAATGTVVDAIYGVFYPCMAAACLCFFLDLGGSFRRWRVWLDVITLYVGLGAIAAIIVMNTQFEISGANFLSVLGYVVGLVSVEVFLALLFVQITNWRSEASVLWLVAAVLACGAADLAWATQDPHVGGWGFAMDAVGHYLGAALLATGLVAEVSRPCPARTAETTDEVGRYSFLPILAVMSSIAVLFGLNGSLDHIARWQLITFSLVVASLVTVRQLAVRSEMHALHRELARRDADNRLTELVRRSADLIAVVNHQDLLVYLSPAAETLLGVAPSQLRLAQARYLIGPQNAPLMQRFLDQIRSPQPPGAELDVSYQMPNGTLRALQVIGSDQLGNPGIRGLVLTVRDVTEQRRLEREVLNDAADERERLAADIHEGLGQDLTGIALLLKGLRIEPQTDVAGVEQAIEAIVGHLNRAIDTARTLAHGLSPLQVARGSLQVALMRLVQDVRDRSGIEVSIDYVDSERVPAPSVADNLYRIAREGLSQALRHADCRRIEVTFEAIDDEFLLTIEHEGTKLRPGTESVNRFGSRMIEYRLRLIGGTLRREAGDGGGPRWVVVAPVSSRPETRDASS